MERIMLKSKIHRAMVTRANPNYEGSISIDEDLLQMADILPYEKVEVYDINNGERFSTYAIKGKKGSGEICVNGAAAKKVEPYDLIIICSYIHVEYEHADAMMPLIVKVDNENRVIK